MVMKKQWIMRSLLLLLKPLLKPSPGEKGKAKTDIKSLDKKGLAIVRYLHALLPGPYLDPYN
jgi:hypothetical protein